MGCVNSASSEFWFLIVAFLPFYLSVDFISPLLSYSEDLVPVYKRSNHLPGRNSCPDVPRMIMRIENTIRNNSLCLIEMIARYFRTSK